MPSLVRANIFQRKTRAAITITAVAIEVAAVLVLVGLTNGTIDEVSERMKNVGADILLQPPGSSPLLGLSDRTMPEAAASRILQVKGVASASPVLFWNTSEISGTPVNIWGIDPQRFESIGGHLEMLEGDHLEEAYDLVVDRRLASANDLSVGQELTVLNQSWRVVGISRAGVGARMFVQLSTLQDLLGLPGKCHLLFIKAENPGIVGEVASNIEAAFPGYRTSLMEQYSQVLRANIVGLSQFNGAVSSVAVTLSFLVILLAMYTSIIERTREIGILKALGASKVYIMRAIMSESVLLCSLGAVAGFGIAFLMRWLLVARYPTLTVEFTVGWMLAAAALGLCGGLLGSLYPALRAARQDAVRALRYE
ncbi:MAG: ABC transporter permease [Acidobacteriota bacterium]